MFLKQVGVYFSEDIFLCLLVYFWNKDSPAVLTIYLLVPSADNLFKQFGPRSGPIKCRARSGSKLFLFSDGILERNFRKNLF